MLHRSIPSRQCHSALTLSSQSVCRLGLVLLGLLLLLQWHLLPVHGQESSQSESAVCTFDGRPVLVGLTSTPEEDQFGDRTSLSQNGTIAAIGAPWYGRSDDDDGYVQVYRFQNNNNAWTPLGSTIFGNTSTWISSNVLSDDGSVLAVGGWYTKNVRVFRLVDGDWESLGNNITNPSGEDIGHALAVSGDGTILAASSPEANSGVGEVLVFALVGDTWSQKGRTHQGQGDEQDFGRSISLSQDGSVLAVGIPDYGNGETNGYVRVFEFIDNDWDQIGQTLQGTNLDDFGNDVSLSSDGQTLAVGAPLFDGNFNDSGAVHVYRFGSDEQWFEPGAMLIGKFADEKFGRSLALSGDASILVTSVSGILRVFEANGDEWIEVGEEATVSSNLNNAAISRDGSTAMGGASIFDISCQQGTTADIATASPVQDKGNSIGVIVGASIGGAVVLAIVMLVGIRRNKRKEDAGKSVRAIEQPGTPEEMSAQRSSSAAESHGQSLPSAAGLIVYDEWGEALAPRTVAAQAVVLESDNLTRLQNNSTKVQAPSVGSLKPSLSRQAIDTPVPEPTLKSSPSNGYVVQYKDQARPIIETPVPEPMAVTSPSNGYLVQYKDQVRPVIETPVPEPMAVSSPSRDYPVQYKDQARSVAALKRRVALDP